MRNCAVAGCTTSSYTIEKWYSYDCKVHKCKCGSLGCTCTPPVSLFPFPTERTDPERRKQWIKLINRKDPTTGKNWVPPKHARVCSKHFIDGRPSAEQPYPTELLGYSNKQPKSRPPPKTRSELETKEKTKNQALDVTVPPNPGDHESYVVTCKCQPQCACAGCIHKEKLIMKLQHDNELLKEQLHDLQNKPPTKPTNISQILRNDRCTRIYTGLTSKQAFHDLLNYVHPYAHKMSYWRGIKQSASTTSTKVPRHFKKSPKQFGPQRKLTQGQELLLTLMKLRQGLSFQVLADMFRIAVGTCSAIFNTWIRMLSMVLKPLIYMIYWPEKDVNQEMIPESLRAQFPELRCTIDCTEVFIGRPRHLELQAQTWSDYKHHNTVKFLVGIAPNGHISFVSKAWGGRVSDRQITHDSGFLDKVEPNDMIMADRGFPIKEDLLVRRAVLYIPPPSSGVEQQSRSDVQKTKLVANGRIHVERAIGRMKWFNILNTTLPINMVPLVDDIIIVCAGLCNLLSPLVT